MPVLDSSGLSAPIRSPEPPMRPRIPSALRPALPLAPVFGPVSALTPPPIAAAAAPPSQGVITSPNLCSPRGTAVASDGSVFVGSDCRALHHMEQFNAVGALVASWGLTPGFEGPPNG